MNPDQARATPRLTPREARAVAALLLGSVSRRDLDRAAHTVHSPGVVYALRHSRGIDVHCERVELSDGEATHYGLYSLEPQSRELARRALDAAGKP